MGNRWKVAGRCLMGCGDTLGVGEDTLLVCTDPACPRPTAVAEILTEDTGQHWVRLEEDTFQVMHPLAERLDQALLTCDLLDDIYQWDALDAVDERGAPRYPVGTYVVVEGEDGWVWQPVGEKPCVPVPCPARPPTAPTASLYSHLLAALDRCEHGRHKKDPCLGCPGGRSTGNLLLATGTRVGTNLYGAPITVPYHDDRSRPDAWVDVPGAFK